MCTELVVSRDPQTCPIQNAYFLNLSVEVEPVFLAKVGHENTIECKTSFLKSNIKNNCFYIIETELNPLNTPTHEGVKEKDVSIIIQPLKNLYFLQLNFANFIPLFQ